MAHDTLDPRSGVFFLTCKNCFVTVVVVSGHTPKTEGGVRMNEVHEFETLDALREAAKEEAIVCGDRAEEKGTTIEIFNWHAGGVRWKGVCKEIPETGMP